MAWVDGDTLLINVEGGACEEAGETCAAGWSIPAGAFVPPSQPTAGLAVRPSPAPAGTAGCPQAFMTYVIRDGLEIRLLERMGRAT